MKKIYMRLLLGLLLAFVALGAGAQVTISGSAGGTLDGTYATLTGTGALPNAGGGAFAALNSTAQTGAAITISITADITAEPGTTSLNAGAWTGITINPSGARTISGTVSTPLLILNGAKNVVIDGLNTGGNSLTISNLSTATTAATIKFIADAATNTVTNCSINGSGTSATIGTIWFSTGTTTGNIGNTISNCSIAAAGANTPVNAIYSLGTSAAVPNTATITGNNIFDYFSATAVTAGICIGATGNTAWTVTNNRLYQTATRIYTTGNTHNGITIGTGAGYTITGNTIGFANAAGTGTTNMVGNSVALTGTFPSAYTTTGTANATRYIGINCTFTAAGAASSIQNNTIAGFALYTSSGATTTNGIFCGIAINAGNANLGTVTGNTIGATSGNGSIYTACTSSSGMIAGIYATSANTVAIQNNMIGALDAMGTTATVGSAINGINIAGTGTFDVSGNKVGNTTAQNLRLGTLVTGGNLSNVGTTFGTTSGVTFFNGILSSATVSVTIGSPSLPNFVRNAVINTTSASTSSIIRGIQAAGNPLTISSNTISELSSPILNTATEPTYAIIGIYSVATSTNIAIDLNTVSGLRATATAASAISVAGTVLTINGAAGNVRRNKIYDLTNTSTASASQIIGIHGYWGTNWTLANNMISLTNGANTNPVLLYGIYDDAGTGITYNYYFNSIYIGGTAASGALGSFAFNRTITTTDVLKNNIFVNARTGGTGVHYAIGNTSTTPATGWSSNYNVLNSVGTIGIWNATGVNFANWKTSSAGDANSLSGVAVNFVNAASGDLHLNMGVTATQIESAGVAGTGITVDYDNDARPGPAGSVNGGASAPDMGADEFDGVPLDATPPTITYTPLTNLLSTANRTTASFATITDASGVNTTSGTRPRIYYKLSTDANVFNDNTSATAGWKWAEAIGTTSPFDFTIDYSILFGSPTITAGNTIQYFVVAQDLAPVANVGINSGIFATTPTSVALTAAAFPITGTINQYLITTPFSGSYNVPGNYPTLTGAGGFFAAINAGTVTGNVTINITGDLVEDGTNALNQWTENPAASNFTLTIQPDAATVRNITGAVANGMIRLNGADRVTIDGRFGGSGKYLRWLNSNTSNTTFTLLNDATYNTITYCTVESGTTATQVGAILFSTTTGTLGNSNNTISYCDIRERTDVTTYPLCLVVSNGTAATQNSTNTVSNCNLFNCYQNGNPGLFLYLSTGSTAWTIANNSFYQTVTRTSTSTNTRMIPIYINNTSGNGFVITGNYIGGTAPLCGGTPFTLTTATTGVHNYMYGIYVGAGTTTPTSIWNNTVQNIALTTIPPTGANVFPFIGINNGSGSIDVQGNTIGATTGNGAITLNDNGNALTSSYSMFLDGMQLSPTGTCTIANNNIGGLTFAGTSTTGTSYRFLRGILLLGTPTAAITVNNNLFGSNATANSLYANMTTSTRPQGILPLLVSLSNTQTVNVTGNTFKNITNTSTATTNTSVMPIDFVGTGVANISGNTIAEVSTASLLTTTTPGSNALTGILLGNTSAGNVISGNTIQGLRGTGNAATAVYAVAINGTGTTGSVTKNRIFDLTNSSTTTTARLYGINDYIGSTWNFSNNMLNINNAANTNAIDIQGVHEETGNTANYYYNSVHIGGTAASGAVSTYAFNRTLTSTVDVRNNIFSNERTGGTGYHVAIANTNTSATGWSAAASNYNDLYSATTATVAQWLGTAAGNTLSFTGWQAAQSAGSGGDAASVSVLPVFNAAATGDLHLITDANCALSGAGNNTGIALATDIDGDTRGGTTTSIGADELTSNFVLNITNPAPSCTAVDITATAVTASSSAGTTLSYWADAGATTAIPAGNGTPSAITVSGTYYIKSVKGSCTGIKPVVVTITAAATNVTLATNSTNAVNLPASCTDGTGWTYYTNPSDATKYLFGINWDPSNTGANAAAKAAATPYLQVDAAPFGITDGAFKGTWTMQRYWNVNLNSATMTGPVNVRFFYDPAEKAATDAARDAFVSAHPGSSALPATWFKTVGTDFAADAAHVTYNGVLNSITLTDASAGATLNSVAYAEFDGVASFSGGTYTASAGSGAPLPISISYFRGAKQGTANVLDWKVNVVSSPTVTLSLERCGDGRSFAPVYNTTASDTRALQPFTYTDANPLAGINYYRLKMTDANGKVTYSSIVTLLNATRGFEMVNIAPNPVVNGTFKLNITTAQQTPMTVIITDMAGRTISSRAVTLTAGFNAVDMNVTNLASGTYQLYGNTTDGKTRVLSFVKK